LDFFSLTGDFNSLLGVIEACDLFPNSDLLSSAFLEEDLALLGALILLVVVVGALNSLLAGASI
jgi:hypothetical protein